MKNLNLILGALLLLTTPSVLHAGEVTNLRCEYRENPLGIDVSTPRLSWEVGDKGKRGQQQTAYQILAASSPDLLKNGTGDLWDSGKIVSDESVHIQYAGVVLRSSQQVFWKARAWDQNGVVSPWSGAAEWTMGLLKPEDWGAARWIGARRQFIPLGMMLVAEKEEEVKTVQVDFGASHSMERVALHPQLLNDPQTGVLTQGYGFPKRFRVELSDDASFTRAETIIDESGKDVQNPGLNPVIYDIKKKGRYVRLTILKHSLRDAKPAYFSALAELEIKSTRADNSSHANIARGASVSSADSVEGDGWAAGHLTDGLGMAPQMKRIAADLPASSPPEKAELRQNPHAAIYLRKELGIDKPVRRAIVSMSGLGMSELHMEGGKVGDAVLSPEFSDYNKRASYVVYDVTDRLKVGRNAIGVILGNGIACTPSLGYLKWYGNGGQPRLLLKLEIEFTDGSRQTVVSDESWTWSTGEITYNDIWIGEHIDARLAKPGWDRGGYDDKAWHTPELVSGPRGRLFARMLPPIRVLETEKPLQIEGNKFTFSTLGTGWLRLRTEGESGDKVVVNYRPGQSKNYAKFNIHGYCVTSECMLKGGGEETFEPKFLFNTLDRVVTVDGLRKPATPETLTRCSTQVDLRRSGSFECSNEFLNRQYAALLRTQRNYNFDYPMDPTREKSGWTQDVLTMINSAVYDFDSALFYWNWWQDMRDNQQQDGYLGSVVPLIDQALDDCNCVWWSGMVIYTPWKLYQYYGDKRFLEESYPTMLAYLDWLACKADKDKVITWGLGDWIEVGSNGGPKRTSKAITSTCGYYHYAKILAQAATILGKRADAERHEQLAGEIRDGFLKRLFNPQTGLVGENPDTQTGHILPLYFDMIPAEKRQLLVDRLVANIHERKDHISTGFVGTLHLLLGLPDLGYQELTYKMVTQQDFPGWNTIVKDGVQMETWEGGQAQMPSLGGPIGAYLYQILGGIRPDLPSVGFKKILIKPSVVGDLSWVKCHYDSVHGRIVSDWRRDAGLLTMEITIPGNTTATVFVPAKDSASVTEGGKAIGKAEGVNFLRMEGGAAVYAVGSGQYSFQAPNP